MMTFTDMHINHIFKISKQSFYSNSYTFSILFYSKSKKTKSYFVFNCLKTYEKKEK